MTRLDMCTIQYYKILCEHDFKNTETIKEVKTMFKLQDNNINNQFYD